MMNKLADEMAKSFCPEWKDQRTGRFIQRGCAWCQKHLINPLHLLETTEVDARTLQLMTEVLYLVGDLAYINSGYSVANRYYQKCYQLVHENRLQNGVVWQREELSRLYDDLAITSAYLGGKGLPPHFSEAWQELLGEPYVTLSLPEIPWNVLQANDFLCDFQFQELLSAFHDDTESSIYVPATLAYAQVGRWDIFWDRFNYITSSCRQDFNRARLVFLPEECFEEERFWKRLLDSSFWLDFDVAFNSGTIQCVPVDKYYEFHLARTTNDYERIKKMFQSFPQWDELEYALEYFNQKGAMPSWKELVSANKSPWL